MAKKMKKIVQLKIPRYVWANREFHFPDENGKLYMQLDHLKSEVVEVEKEIKQQTNNHIRGKGFEKQKIAEEIVDVMHSATTLLFILGADIDAAHEAVVRKNKRRGYLI